jgi:Bifunctional DNA primase/polymerase, N-terminal
MMDGPKPKASWEGVAPFPCAAKLHDWDLAFAIAAQQKTLKEAALYLAARGYPVIPCDPDPTHGPQFKGVLGYLASNGVYDATTNPETVERWWTEKPDALIGFPTGAITGCLVLDVDASPPHAHDGIRAWGELEVQHGSVTTRRHRTGNAIPSLTCRAWKGRSNPLLLTALRFAPESRHRERRDPYLLRLQLRSTTG